MNALPSFRAIWAGLWVPRVRAENGLAIERHLEAGLDWIERAWSATCEGGISKGFDLLRGSWAPSYPETTGYTIPTLLNAAVAFRPELREMALALADYLLDAATPEGGVAHWEDPGGHPIAFDTGQALFGWLAAFEASGDERYLQASRAGDWLVSIQHPSGSWRDHQHLDVEKVIDTRVAWALLRLHRHTRRDAHRTAAIANLEWALVNQTEDGWFHNCAFLGREAPFVHTLAYTAEGLLECGSLLDEPRYIRAAQRTADALLARQLPDGRLPSSFGPAWHSTSRSCCLTGNCQMACLWLRFHRMDGSPEYLDAARRALSFVASTQSVAGPDPDIRGAIAGSSPIFGRYERFKYPNWAAKFFVDALMLLDQVENKRTPLPYVG